MLEINNLWIVKLIDVLSYAIREERDGSIYDWGITFGTKELRTMSH